MKIFSFFFPPFLLSSVGKQRGVEEQHDARVIYFKRAKGEKGKQWRLHNCGNTTEATILPQQFIGEKKKWRYGNYSVDVSRRLQFFFFKC